MKDLPQRLLTALLGATIFIGALFLDPITLAIAFGLICLMSAIELGSLGQKIHDLDRSWLIAPIVFGLGFLLPLSFYPAFLSNGQPSSPLMIGGILMAVAALPALKNIAGSWRIAPSLAVSLGGMLWIALPCLLMIQLGQDPSQGPWTVLGILVLIWSCDIGAFFAGNFFGRTKLAPRISPNKTWEGVIGGLILALAISFALSELFEHYLFSVWATIALLCSVFGTLGDLLESWLKRKSEVKDSGSLLPGHGGFLDRFDSMFVVTPVCWIYLMLLFPHSP